MAQETLEIPRSILVTALETQLSSGHVTRSDLDGLPAIFLTHLHQAERSIAERLQAACAADATATRGLGVVAGQRRRRVDQGPLALARVLLRSARS